MKHQKQRATLGRTKAQREALLRNLAESLILHGSIKTTKAKACALRRFIEPLVTKARRSTLADRRMLYEVLYTKKAVNKLFDDIAPKYKGRPGGYTRIVKIGIRPTDGAEKVRMEFVS